LRRPHRRIEASVPSWEYRNPQSGRHFFFIIFVDRIFTTLFERLFTKVFDVTGANSAFSDLYRARNAD
jgi:hypothetical protein